MSAGKVRALRRRTGERHGAGLLGSGGIGSNGGE